MKYGKKLLAVKNSSDPEWAPFWPNYKLLKVKIKEIQVMQQADIAGSSIEAATPPSSEEPLRCETSTIQRSAGEVAFFKVWRTMLSLKPKGGTNHAPVIRFCLFPNFSLRTSP